MKIRTHRGSLVDSMETLVEIEPTMVAVHEWVKSTLENKLPARLTVTKYGYGIDPRTGWDTYVVILPGCGVLGFTDGPLKASP